MQQNVGFISTTLYRVDMVFIKKGTRKKSSQQCLGHSHYQTFYRKI